MGSIDTNLAVGNATGIADGEGQTVPVKFALEQNYPNPFNPTTTIRYQLPDRAEVSLKIFDITGHEVRTLVKEILAAGEHSVTWNGTNDRGIPVSSGVYLYQLKAGNRTESRRMLLLK
jgi:flagellar hook assembly protein FlgD